MTAAPRQPVQADPDALRRAADSLRDAVREHGPAALIPAAHGRLTTAVRCLATAAAHLDPATPASVQALLAEVRLAVAELDAYDAARPSRRASAPAATPPAASRGRRPAGNPAGPRPPQVRAGAGPGATGDY